MSALCFVDTNVLVYARDTSEPVKQPQAHAWLTPLWHQRNGRTSIQVLNEYFVTVTRKLDPGMSDKDAWQDIDDLLSWKPTPVDEPIIRKARTAHQRFALSWWDALIVAAAQTGNCAYLLSEDLQDGQDLDGMCIINPFRHEPEEVLTVG